MRAMVLHRQGPIEQAPLRSFRLADPLPGKGEIRIRVQACGVCRTDLHLVEGDLRVDRFPLIPGHQVVGEVEALGEGVPGNRLGRRVGLAWLQRTCGDCAFCTSGRENLCPEAAFTGWTKPGGFAELVCAPADFVYELPEGFSTLEAAPLLCAGIIGFRALKLTGFREWKGRKLGLYGFGAAGHVALQVARARGAEVFVVTRDRKKHMKLAEDLGACWVGTADDSLPETLDAAIIFAPSGVLVPKALASLDRGGVLVLGGIHMSDVPQLPYSLLYEERRIQSVMNNTREDGREFLVEAARIPVRVETEIYELAGANEALKELKTGAVLGAAVLKHP